MAEQNHGVRNPEVEQAIAAGMPPCPNCHGQNVRQSHSIGLWDTILALAAYAPFRCRVCQHRFYKRPPKSETSPDHTRN
jgi:hypothetical protein